MLIHRLRLMKNGAIVIRRRYLMSALLRAFQLPYESHTEPSKWLLDSVFSTKSSCPRFGTDKHLKLYSDYFCWPRRASSLVTILNVIIKLVETWKHLSSYTYYTHYSVRFFSISIEITNQFLNP